VFGHYTSVGGEEKKGARAERRIRMADGMQKEKSFWSDQISLAFNEGKQQREKIKQNNGD